MVSEPMWGEGGVLLSRVRRADVGRDEGSEGWSCPQRTKNEKGGEVSVWPAADRQTPAPCSPECETRFIRGRPGVKISWKSVAWRPRAWKALLQRQLDWVVVQGSDGVGHSQWRVSLRAQ